jgi:hypothetical protein
VDQKGLFSAATDPSNVDRGGSYGFGGIIPCGLTLELSGHINREAIDWSA